MDDKQIALVESLVDRSEQGRIAWKKTAEPELFLAAIGNFIVSVSRLEESSSGIYSHVIEISNSDDETVERISTDATRERLGRPSVNGRIVRLHELARRRAHGADEAIDAILGALNSAT